MFHSSLLTVMTPQKKKKIEQFRNNAKWHNDCKILHHVRTWSAIGSDQTYTHFLNRHLLCFYFGFLCYVVIFRCNSSSYCSEFILLAYCFCLVFILFVCCLTVVHFSIFPFCILFYFFLFFLFFRYRTTIVVRRNSFKYFQMHRQKNRQQS